MGERDDRDALRKVLRWDGYNKAGEWLYRAPQIIVEDVNEEVEKAAVNPETARLWIITDFEKLEGKEIGFGRFKGECPGICQAHGGVPHTSLWIEGPKVKGNPAIPYGTALATFINGRYPSASHGNHVAIFIKQDERQGVYVFDQWRGQPAHYRWMPFGDGVSDRSNDGFALSVLLTLREIAKPARKAG